MVAPSTGEEPNTPAKRKSTASPMKPKMAIHFTEKAREKQTKAATISR